MWREQGNELIEMVCAHWDALVLISAHNGSGKTLGSKLPISRLVVNDLENECIGDLALFKSMTAERRALGYRR